MGVLGFLAHDVLVDKADRQPAVPHKVVPVCREMLPLVRLHAEPAGGSSYASTSKSRIAEEGDSGYLRNYVDVAGSAEADAVYGLVVEANGELVYDVVHVVRNQLRFVFRVFQGW